LNYHSPDWDIVLKQAYFNAKGSIAVGSNGLLNPGIFENLRVNCTHLGHTSYVRLIPGIVGLLAQSQAILSSERVEKPWLSLATVNIGEWDNLHYMDGHIIQWNSITGYFRAIEAGGLHRERFYSKCVIPLLNAILALPK
jgi:hypothetical protein